MKSKIFFFQIVFFLILINVSEAQILDPLSVYNSEMKNEKILVKDITGSITHDTTLCPFKSENALTTLSVSGNFKSFSKKSFLRMILVDSNGDEHLIYECNYLTIDSLDFEFKNEFEETGFLNNVRPVFIRIQISKSVLSNLRFNYTETLEDKENKIKLLKQSLFKNKRDQKISQINKRNTILNQKWVAGETSISNMTYSEKKKMFGDSLPNLMGFEYYKGGFFEIPDDSIPVPSKTKLRSTTTSSQMVDYFDWRNRHGVNWNTPVRHQYSGTCWAFSAVGATEAMVNLYYNKKLDIDLSEGEIVSCNTSETISDCDGGVSLVALKYIKDNGVVNQQCFPNDDCSALCTTKAPNPLEKIKISDYYKFMINNNLTNTENETELKKIIISKGVVAGQVLSWNHAMAITGFGTIKIGDTIHTDLYVKKTITDNDVNLIGRTYWIVKNSWGSNWGEYNYGEYGYGFILVNINELDESPYPESPITSINYSDANIICEDNDGDGYYNWGIGPKPNYIVSPCMTLEDGDDSNPNLGPMDEYGILQALTMPVNYNATNINSHVYYMIDKHLFGDLVIEQNGVLEVYANLFFPQHYQIKVKSGGKLIVKNNGVIKNANIKVEAGGSLEIYGNGVLEKKSNDELIIESGASFDCNNAEVKQIN